MCLTALRISSSEQVPQVPRGGIPRIPFIECVTRVSSPCAMRGAQACASPNLGAPAAPDEWHAMHAPLYTCSPVLGPAATAGAGAAQLPLPSIQTSPTGAIRSAIAFSRSVWAWVPRLADTARTPAATQKMLRLIDTCGPSGLWRLYEGPRHLVFGGADYSDRPRHQNSHAARLAWTLLGAGGYHRARRRDAAESAARQ